MSPVASAHVPSKNYLFQDDNAPFITGTKYYEHGMACSSPDMNIIENFWRKLKQGT